MRTEKRGDAEKERDKEAALRRDLAAFQDQMIALKGDALPDEAWPLIEDAQAMPDPMAQVAEKGLGPDLPTFIRPRDR